MLLDVETDIISTVRSLYIFVVHLNAENVSSTSRGVKLDIDSRGNLSLFHSASHHITDSLDFVHSGYRHSERLLIVTLWRFHHFLQRVDQGMSLHLLFLDLHLEAFVPWHVLGRLVQVITVESTHWDKRDLLRLVTNFGEHFVDLTLDLFVSVLAPVYRFIVHFVDSNNDLFDSQKMAQSCMLTGLTLDLSLLVVSFSDRCLETTFVRGNHQQSDISLSCSRNHVLNEITMTGCINDGVMIRIGEELSSAALDGHTTSSLIFSFVHEKCKEKRFFSQFLSLLLQFSQISIAHTAQFEQQTSGGGGFTGIDMTHNDKTQMRFTFSHCYCVWIS